jgi:hypothetical protein
MEPAGICGITVSQSFSLPKIEQVTNSAISKYNVKPYATQKSLKKIKINE